MKMNSPLTVVGIFIVASAISSGSRGEAQLAVKPLQPREAKAFQYDKATQAAVNAEFTFEVAAKPEIDDHNVKFSGFLANAGHQTKTVYLATKTPFELDLVPDENVTSKPADPKTPTLFVVDVPPKTKIPFTALMPLAQIRYVGEPVANFKWTFRFWSDPRPSGLIKLKLPARTAEALKLTIERFENISTKSAKLVATLTNVSPAPQLFCKNLVRWMDPLSEEKALPLEAKAKSDCQVLSPDESTEVETATLANGELRTPSTTLKNLTRLKVRVENAATQDLAAKYRAPSPVKTIETTTSL